MLIENSVARVTVRHHEACRVMPNSYPEWWNFQFATNNHYGFFFLYTLPSQLHLCLKICYFIKITLKQLHFSIKRCSVRFLPKTLTSKRFAENDVNMTSRLPIWCQNVKIVILTSCTKVVLHPSCKPTFPSPGRVHGNSGRYARKRDRHHNFE